MTVQHDYIDLSFRIIRKHKIALFLVPIPIFVAVVVYAFSLTPVYQADTTILVEGQQIPKEYVKTSIDNYVEERLAIIRQQVLSRTKLVEIINQENLYQEMQERYTSSEIINKMRANITISTINAERGGRRGSATIAFTLAYRGKHPSTVQKITNLLATLYISENSKNRERRATTTAKYLEGELKNTKIELEKVDQKIIELKTLYLTALPEYTNINLQTLERLYTEYDQKNFEIRTLKEKKVYLDGQLSFLITQMSKSRDADKSIVDPIVESDNYLKLLQARLNTMRSEFTDKHPDVIKLKREIKGLETRELDAVSNDSSGVEKKASNDAGNLLISSSYSSGSETENPIAQSLIIQLETIEIDVANLQSEKLSLKEKIAQYQKRLENTPLVEREYTNLLRDRQNYNQRYNQIMKQLGEAKAALALEESQRSERFTIIEPANMPDKPFKPNRIRILILGLFIAFGVGGGIAVVLESLDTTIESAEKLASLTDLPVLATIPRVLTATQRRQRRLKTTVYACVVLVLVAGGLYAVHTFYMPLDLLYIKIQNRLS